MTTSNGSILIKICVIGLILITVGVIAFISFPYIYLKFIGEQHQITGASMMPTYKDGQFVSLKDIDTLERGEIVIVYYPELEPTIPVYKFAKRIIGLPGESIKIENNTVYINGQQLREPYLEPNVITRGGSFLLEGQTFLIPENSYFVMGDNRQQSNDSRTMGPSTREKILSEVR